MAYNCDRSLVLYTRTPTYYNIYYSDKTISESVFDFISDVVPQVGQAYSSVVPKTDDREKVLWIFLEKCDVNGECKI